MDEPKIETMVALAQTYGQWQTTTNYAVSTVMRTRLVLQDFFNWCARREPHRPDEIDRGILEDYQRCLFNRKSKTTGKPLKMSYQAGTLTHIRGFFRWLSRKNYIAFNPAADLDLPRRERTIPQTVLTHRQVERVLRLPRVNNPIGLRDRAIMETLYSTGMRRFELVNLKLYDVDREQGTVIIRLGKGKKDRMIPIGRRALFWIEKYLVEARPRWYPVPDEGFLFISFYRRPVGVQLVSKMVRSYLDKAGIKKKGACHYFRHSMATAMLDRGADIRFIQEMLGHSKLETTQLYTKVSIKKLKQVHTRTHPAKWNRGAE